MMPTVKQQLADALEEIVMGFGHKARESDDWEFSISNELLEKARLALDRARASPEWLSQCCGATPHESTDIVAPTTSTPIGVCGKCREHTAFERTDSHKREDLLVALDELFEEHYWDVGADSWKAAETAFKAAQSELSCPDICDTSCSCYQAGLEAQRGAKK